MSKINQKEWVNLLNLSEMPTSELRKSNLGKFGGSCILLTVYSFAAYNLNLLNDVYLCIVMIFFAATNFTLTYFSNSESQYLRILQFAKISSMSSVGVAALLNLDGESIRFAFIFTFIYFVYIYDFYKWEKFRFLSLYILAMAMALFFPEPVIFKIVLLLIISFITYIARDNIKLKEENRKLHHIEKSYSVFQSHSNLMEHHILNSVTKLLYYRHLLSQVEDKNVKDISDDISKEIEFIEKVLTETEGNDLQQFSYRDSK